MTLRNGKSKYSPWYSHASFQNIGRQARTASSHTVRLSRKRRSNGCSSVVVADFADAHLDAAVRQQVERRHPFGHTSRMVRRQLDDAVAEPDVLRPLARGTEEHLGRGAVRVLLEEVVLDLPRVVVAEAVGELDLVEAVVEQPVLVAVGPRPGQLVLVEDPELHRSSGPTWASCHRRRRVRLVIDRMTRRPSDRRM